MCGFRPIMASPNCRVTRHHDRVPESGFVSIAELSALSGTLGLPVGCDLNFEAKQTFAAQYRPCKSWLLLVSLTPC